MMSVFRRNLLSELVRESKCKLMLTLKPLEWPRYVSQLQDPKRALERQVLWDTRRPGRYTLRGKVCLIYQVILTPPIRTC